MPEARPAQLEWMLGLVVHDLRNPAATLAANLGFVRDGISDPSLPQSELQEALADSQQALTDLMRGLDQLAWMGRWFNDRETHATVVQDVGDLFERARSRVKHGPVEFMPLISPLKVAGGEALERLLEILVSNGHQHAPNKLVRVSASQAPSTDAVIIEIRDEARPLASEFGQLAFTLDGQLQIKGRADGRYGRVLGLFAAGILAHNLGAELTSHEQDGHNVFRIRLRAG